MNKGFAVLPLVILIALAGAVASGTVKFNHYKPTLDKTAASQAFKTGKSSDWQHLNK